MRILLATVGSRGDVQPFIDLGRRMVDRGDTVTLATHEPFRADVTAAGIAFAPLPGDPLAVLATPQARALLVRGVGLVGFARRFLSVLRPWFDELVEAVTPLVDGSQDHILYTPLAFPAWHLAQVTGTATSMVTFQPLAPTRAFPAITWAGPSLGGPLSLVTHRVNQQLFWQPLRRPVDRWRNQLGLPPLGVGGPYPVLAESGELQLVGASPTVVRRPPDWPPAVHLTGAWWNPSRGSSEIPARFEEHRVVYVGFGSMADDGDDLVEIVTEAAVRSDTRVLLAAGWTGLAPGQVDDRVEIVGDVDHGSLFPRLDGIVHHGGAGTTHTALRSGTPSVAVPFFADQPFWAERIHRLGAGPAPVSRRLLDPDSLQRILHALPDHRERAIEVGDLVRAEDGIATTLRLIDRPRPRQR